jgi:hypothetical protein
MSTIVSAFMMSQAQAQAALQEPGAYVFYHPYADLYSSSRLRYEPYRAIDLRMSAHQRSRVLGAHRTGKR